MSSIETVFILLILFFVGWILSYIGWLNYEIKSFLNKLILNIGIPSLIVITFFETLDKEMLNSLNFILIPLTSITLSFFGALALAYMLKISKMRQGTFVSMSVASNSMFFGLPVCLSLLGNKCVPYVIFYYIANTIFFWLILAPIIMENGDKKSIVVVERLKNILNIPLITVIISIILLSLNFKPPILIVKVADYFSSIVTPLSSLVVGNIIYEINFKSFKFDWSILAVLFMKFMVLPFVVFSISKIFDLPILVRKVFTIQASMPVMMQTAIVTESSGKDSKYAAVILSITNILSLVLIPIYMWIINNFI